MNTQGLKTAILKGLAKTKDASPTIFTLLAVGGTVSAIILAVKGGVDAKRIVDQKKREIFDADDENVLDSPEDVTFTKKEIIGMTWKCFIPAVTTGAASIGCAIASNHINLKRNAAIASLYAINEKKLKSYEEQIDKILPKKEADKLKESVVAEDMKKHPVITDQIKMTGRGDFLCKDWYTGRYFRSDIDFLRRVENLYNQRMIQEWCLSLNDLYEMMDLDCVGCGDLVGWNTNGLMEFDFTTSQASNGEPCLIIDYKINPSYMYRG